MLWMDLAYQKYRKEEKKKKKSSQTNQKITMSLSLSEVILACR